MHVSTPHLVEFAESAMKADYTRLRKVGQLIARELDAFDEEGARLFRSAIARKGVPLQASGFIETLPVDGKSRLPLLEEHPWPSSPILLSAEGRETFQYFLDDVQNFQLLTEKGVASRLALLLSGPPGTGKTLLAGHIAAQLGRRLYVARLDSMISSMLGDTAKNIRNIFDFVAGKNAVLFLDELDAVAKMRDDRNELGELKRVVNTVIQGIDSLDHNAIVIAATNHAQMLDSAIWRRFPYKIEFTKPDIHLREALWLHFLGDTEQYRETSTLLSKISDGLTGAEIEQYAFTARRRALINKEENLDFARLAMQLAIKAKGRIDVHHDKPNDQKKKIAQILVNDFELSQADTARLINVSRQAVSTYLR